MDGEMKARWNNGGGTNEMGERKRSNLYTWIVPRTSLTHLRSDLLDWTEEVVQRVLGRLSKVARNLYTGLEEGQKYQYFSSPREKKKIEGAVAVHNKKE
jgi:hypothetical protein